MNGAGDLYAVAAAAALLLPVLIAGVFAVYRRGDMERVARECAHDAVCMEREATHRTLLTNAAALRRSGRRQHAKVVEELLALLKARPVKLDVEVNLSRKKEPRHGQEKREVSRSEVAPVADDDDGEAGAHLHPTESATP